MLAVALRNRNRVFGALLLWRERDQPAFDESDEFYGMRLASRLALGLSTHPVLASIAPVVRG